MTRQYVGARYVPQFSDVNEGEWSSQYSYESLTIVKHGVDFYTSKKPVPVGIEITNKSYWVKTGDYSGVMQHLESEIQAVDVKVDDVTDDFNMLTSSLRSKILCHRGLTLYSPYAQDNSIFALMDASIHGFRGCEVDPRKDVNGEIVLLHNETVDSVSSSTGYIDRLDYKNVFYKTKTNETTGTHLTTLQEAVLFAKTYNMFLLFDMGKNICTCAEISAICENANYRDYGFFNANMQEYITLPDHVIKTVTFNDGEYTQADLDGFKTITQNAKNLACRVIYGVNASQLELLHDNGFLIIANYDNSTTIGAVNESIASYIDYMLGDGLPESTLPNYYNGVYLVKPSCDLEDFVDALPVRIHTQCQVESGANTPTAANYICDINKYSNGYIQLVARTFDMTGNDIYVKMKASGVWGSWEKYIAPTTSVISTASANNIDVFGQCKNGIVTIGLRREGGGSALSGWQQLATLPAEYRPTLMYDFVVKVGAEITMGRVTPDGVVGMYGDANGNVGGCVTFPI